MATFFCDEEIEKLQDGSSLAILRMRGYIQFEAVGEMEKHIESCYDKGIKCLALEFSQVYSITSSGLGTLMKVYDQFQSAGRYLVFLSMPKKIYTLFETLGIASYFLKFNTKKELIEFFTQGILPEMSSFSEDTEGLLSQEEEEKKKPAKRPFNKKETLFDMNIIQDVQNESLLKQEKKIPQQASKELHAIEKISEDSHKKEAAHNPITKSIKKSSVDTRKIGVSSYPCKITIKSYSMMETGKTYTAKVAVFSSSEKNAGEIANSVEESLEITSVALFPGCIVSPCFRKVYIGSKLSSAFFEITPIITGKQTAKIEALASASSVEAFGSACSVSSDSRRLASMPARWAKACSEHL